MQNIKLEIEYDGTDFYGWEIQPDRRTVRGALESKLKSILNEKVKLACGARTDTGVHAIAQTANFKTRTSFKPEKIKRALFKLPHDIYVRSAASVPLEFDSHFDGISRTYLYKMVLGKSPIRRMKIWEYKFPLDVDNVKSALPLFLGTHKFDSFSCKDTGECDIESFTLSKNKDELIFEISADHFLHRMVRVIIGALTELGRGKITEKHIKSALKLSSNGLKYRCAPPQGLYLKRIKYPVD